MLDRYFLALLPDFSSYSFGVIHSSTSPLWGGCTWIHFPLEPDSYLFTWRRAGRDLHRTCITPLEPNPCPTLAGPLMSSIFSSLFPRCCSVDVVSPTTVALFVDPWLVSSLLLQPIKSQTANFKQSFCPDPNENQFHRNPIMIVLQHFQHVSPNILHCPLTHMPSKANMPVLKGSVPLKKLFCSNALIWSRNGVRCVSSTSFGPKSAPKTKFWKF